MRSGRLSRIRDEVIEALKDLAGKTKARIYLFGSHARGDHTLESDVDILVVSNEFKGLSHPKRVERVRAKLPKHIGFDIIALTEDEFKEKKNRAFYRDISKRWIVIGTKNSNPTLLLHQQDEKGHR